MISGTSTGGRGERPQLRRDLRIEVDGTHARRNSDCSSGAPARMARHLHALRLGYFDDETCTLEPIENPFTPKVLPMCSE